MVAGKRVERDWAVRVLLYGGGGVGTLLAGSGMLSACGKRLYAGGEGW